MHRLVTVTGFADALASGIVVLDGGLATELEAHGHNLRDSLWSARLLRDDPAAIVDAHRAFFDAGAEVAITASYHVSYGGFTDAEITELLARSVALAREAQPSGRRTFVAAPRMAAWRPLGIVSIASRSGPPAVTAAIRAAAR